MQSAPLNLPLVASDSCHDDRDWRWQAQHSRRGLADLERELVLTDSEREGIAHALSSGFPIAITPYYLSLCDPVDPNCPIRKQCIPVAAEQEYTEGDLRDPLGEEAHEVAPRLIQRYPDRALLFFTDRCGVYCRFCTRSRIVGAGGGAASLPSLAPALAYLEAHPQIREVIVSGGDPLVMATKKIKALLKRLAEIPSLNNVRIASRTPVTLPQRIDLELCEALRAHPATWLMTHFNHPKEITPQASAACQKLVDHGIPVMNQTVLLRGINDSAATLESLFRALVALRVRPYYLLQADPVSGTGHLRTPLQTGIDVMSSLQGRLSGIALPKFIVDTPGGHGKVPVGAQTIEAREGKRTTLRTFRGALVDYLDP